MLSLERFYQDISNVILLDDDMILDQVLKDEKRKPSGGILYFVSCQERLYQEIRNVVGLDHDMTLQSIKYTPYLDQVLKKTLM